MDQHKPTPDPSAEASTNDQRFLLNFIFGTYLGPDVKTDIPRRSASQRMADGLPPYHVTDLGSAFLKLSDVENMYYYVLRNAHPSSILKLKFLYLYFKGKLPPSSLDSLEDECQFTRFFPTNLHTQSRYQGTVQMVKGIVIIDDPDVSYVKPEDLKRFKQLTGVNELKIDRDEAQFYCHGYRTNRAKSAMEKRRKHITNGSTSASAPRRDSWKRKHLRDPLQVQVPFQTALRVKPPIEKSLPGPAMAVLGSVPNMEQWSPETSVMLSGTAKKGKVGPSVGLVDIGISKNAYLFRVSLPGIKKDLSQFSCDIEYNGKVQLRGITATGEKEISRNSRVFQMITNQLCPPGPFTVSFNLPGPVDPRLFRPYFRSDGIFEAIVMKCGEPNSTASRRYS